MISFFGCFLLLLAPILLILIVRLKRRQRVVYSHTFLQAFQEARLQDYLLRTFQLYHDVFFDLLMAVVLSLFLARIVSFTPGRTAVCIDGSFSMIQGKGQTPLERATGLLFDGTLTDGPYRLFLLAFDPKRGQSRLFRLGAPKAPRQSEKTDLAATVKSFSEELRREHTFHSVDLAVVQDLFDRGFQRVIFLTDSFPGSQTIMEVVEVGGSPGSFFYPSSITYDFASGRFQVLLFRFDYERQLALLRYDEKARLYKMVPAAEQPVPGSDLSLLEIEGEGLYRILGPGLDYIFQLRKPIIRAEISGRYARILSDALPQLEAGGTEVLLADLTDGGQTVKTLKRRIRSLGTYPLTLITLIPETGRQGLPLLHPLERSFSQPSYTEFPEELLALQGEADHLFFQDPGRLRDGQTPLVYLSYLEADRPPVFALSGVENRVLNGWRKSPEHSGTTSFAYTRGGLILPVNLSPQEFFPLAGRKQPVFTARRLNPLPYFLILLLLYLGKLAFLVYFHSSR